MNSEESADFCRRIRLEREKRRWTLEETAGKAGLSARSLQAYEQGDRTPRLDNALALSAVLDVPIQRRELMPPAPQPWLGGDPSAEPPPDYTADLPEPAATWTDASQWPTILIEHADTGNCWFGIDLQPVLVRFDPLRVGVRRGSAGDVNNGKTEAPAR
jgi:transcriptional regulator with XRE-family HTH domain